MPCCPQPPLPVIGLLCSSVAGVAIKCGYQIGDTVYKKWRLEVTLLDAPVDLSPVTCPDPPFDASLLQQRVSYSDRNNYFYAFHVNIDTCETIEDHVATVTYTLDYYYVGGSCTETLYSSCSRTLIGFACSFCCCPTLSTVDVIVDPDDIYTFEDLIGQVDADIARQTYSPYRGCETGFSQLEIMAEGNIANKTQTKLKLYHSPTVSCFLRVWLEKITNGEAENFMVYTWNGGSPICLADSSQSPEALVNQIQVDLPILLAPAVPGISIVRIKKFSILPSYTPPDDGSANGYPP